MFRLLRYFSLTSALAVVAVSAVLLVIYRQSAVNDLVDLAENQNLVLARSFANIIWPKFSSYVASTPGMDGDTLQARPETRKIHEALKGLTSGLPVLKVKVYNLDGLTVYSSEPGEIGIYKVNNPGLIAAARDGIPASKLTYRDTFSAFSGEVLNRDLVESYLPIRLGDGPIEGVFELYSDVTPLVDRIEGATIELLAGFGLVFGLLYGGLVLIVRRADRILTQQYATLEGEVGERKKAEGALKEAHDELEQRVEKRTRELTEEIAERRQAEESLRKLSRAVEQSPAMTIITDLSGKIEYVNSRFTEVTGYTLEEVVGKTPRILKSGELATEEYEELWNTIISGKEWRGEMHNRKKNGQLYWASTSILPITNQAGGVTHFLGISEDITERKRAEDEARRHRNELAHAGAVIIMGEMATSLAHELNQPLTVISGCAQVCLDRLRSNGSKPGDLVDAMEQVAEQAKRANEIVRRVRSFIQKEERDRGEIDVNEAIRNVADLLRSDAREHGAAIKLDLAHGLPPVIADPFQIQQVILNLAHNGMEAMREGRSSSRRLTIHTSVGRDAVVETTVHDTGAGIPPETLERVFDPFFTTKATGLGMGLSISRSIIEAHGGRLWATSDSETGTGVHFTLPAAEERRSDDA